MGVGAPSAVCTRSPEHVVTARHAESVGPLYQSPSHWQVRSVVAVGGSSSTRCESAEHVLIAVHCRSVLWVGAADWNWVVASQTESAAQMVPVK